MKDFPVIKIVIAFIIGILLSKILIIDFWILSVSTLAIIISYFVLNRSFYSGMNNLLLSIAVLILFALLGSLNVQLSKSKINPGIKKLYRESNVSVYGTIEKIELLRRKELLFEFSADTFKTKNKIFTGKTKLLCKLRGDGKSRGIFYQKVKPGNVLIIHGYYSKGSEQRNPGEFDYNKYLNSKNIAGLLYIDSLSQIKTVSENSCFFENVIFQIRKNIDEQIKSLHNPQTAALLKGLLLADRRDINYETKTMFINSGVVHVLAVSGLHVGFIAFIFIVLFGRFNIYLRSLLTILGLIIFMFITGIPPSVFRATVMAVVIIIAFLTNRSTNLFNSIAIAALIILIVNPEEIYSPGFQLSFTAVLSIAAIYPPIENQIRKWGINSKIIKYILLFAGVSLAAQIGTLPLTLIYFRKISVVALLTNLLVIPGIGIIISLAFTTLVFNLFAGFMAGVYAAANDFISGILFKIVDYTGSMNFSFIRMNNYSLYDGIVFYFFLLLFLIFLNRFSKTAAKLILISLVAINIYLFSGLDDKPLLPDNELSILMIDVGQGDSFLIKFPNGKIALTDAGAVSPHFDSGKRIIMPLLDYLGIEKIDYGFVSHIDLDHYGGFISLILKDKIGKIFKPVIDSTQLKDVRFENLLRAHSLPYTYYDSDILTIGNCKIYILNNSSEANYYNFKSNNRSGFMKLVYGNTSILFTGDLEKDGEKIFINDFNKFLDVDVLKVGHHGSNTSTSEKLLNLTTPQLALISAGVQNKFGHPNKEVIDRLKRNNINILRTDKSGAVLLHSNGNNFWIDNWHLN